MLYTSTRNHNGSWTARHSLSSDRTEDGGLFVPMRLPGFSEEQVTQLLHGSAADAAAKVLNLLFGASLTGRDLEFLVGKEFCRVCSLNHRLTVGELWRNPQGDYQRTLQILTGHLLADGNVRPSLWAKTGVELAMLFAVFAQLSGDSGGAPPQPLDVVVLSEDFTTPMAAWYARKMGLPIGTIVCCCNENSGVWDLLLRGQMKTDPPVTATNTPLCDIPVPAGLEWLIYETMGQQEVLRFAAVCQDAQTYEPDPVGLAQLRNGMYAAVVGQERLMNIIPNVYSATGYVLSPYSALCYLGLMDYRAMTGRNAPALMVCRHDPMGCAPAVAKAMGISQQELSQRIKQM